MDRSSLIFIDTKINRRSFLANTHNAMMTVHGQHVLSFHRHLFSFIFTLLRPLSKNSQMAFSSPQSLLNQVQLHGPLNVFENLLSGMIQNSRPISHVRMGRSPHYVFTFRYMGFHISLEAPSRKSDWSSHEFWVIKAWFMGTSHSKLTNGILLPVR